jgi:arsenate reductase (thioredoxin)
MAEAILNSLRGSKYEAQSAGVTPTTVNPYVVKVMAEVGLDISKNRSKSIEEFREQQFDYVVTVCDSAKETCPFFPGKKVIHKAFNDPSGFKGSDEKILEGTRQVRNKIEEWLKNTFN